jgi:hypothetical protein
MNKPNKIDRFLDLALDQMFKAVGFEGFDKEFTQDKEWFRKKSWTSEQEQAFKAWFIETARKKLRWSKKTAEDEFSWFNFMWGWTSADEKLPQ